MNEIDAMRAIARAYQLADRRKSRAYDIARDKARALIASLDADEQTRVTVWAEARFGDKR